VFSFVLLLISDRDPSVLEPLEMFAYAVMLYGSVTLLIEIFRDDGGQK
jgi:prolipoprotein diacylglyceryltransferase